MNSNCLVTIILLVLLFNVVISAQQIFPFETSKTEIQKEHKLSEIRIEILNKNIKMFYGNDNFENINFYILDDLKKNTICELQFFYFLGFYKDSLFSIISSTDELSANFELKDEKCLNSEFFNSDSIQTMYFARKSSTTSGGNIFGEAGTVIQNSYENKYVVELISTGMSVFSPSHKQYAFIILSRNIVDRLNKNLKIHPDYKEEINPSDMFSTSMYENFEMLQKPMNKDD